MAIEDFWERLIFWLFKKSNLFITRYSQSFGSELEDLKINKSKKLVIIISSLS
ncbi:hypothetical protein M595_1960 [Lyngbya aestuarii BL J]|uniref:Uncharacterized protein n=1 Tax=Lyngbya aestuarii BL J TaxID=1348334 RepID=U7QNL9_9CYAN|nr:hypothetical protein M595_1960 [Lyngbya aestuarii BL J]